MHTRGWIKSGIGYIWYFTFPFRSFFFFLVLSRTKTSISPNQWDGHEEPGRSKGINSSRVRPNPSLSRGITHIWAMLGGISIVKGSQMKEGAARCQSHSFGLSDLVTSVLICCHRHHVIIITVFISTSTTGLVLVAQWSHRAIFGALQHPNCAHEEKQANNAGSCLSILINVLIIFTSSVSSCSSSSGTSAPSASSAQLARRFKAVRTAAKASVWPGRGRN